MKIVIVAAGLATRLRPITNYIPKILVNVGKNTGLVEIVNCWLDAKRHLRADEVTGFKIVIHSKFQSLVEAYWSLYFPNVEMQTIVYDESPGTAKTIHDVAQRPEMADILNDEVVFSWCDVYPGDTSFAFAGGDKKTHCRTHITAVTADTDNRYDLRDGRFVQCKNGGNVIGIYHFSHGFKPELIANYSPGDDFVEALNRAPTELVAPSIGSLHLGENVNDFGDKPKLTSLIERLNDGAREFNSLTFYDCPALVHKRATNAQGRGLIGREIKWYATLNRLCWSAGGRPTPYVPKIFTSPDNDEFYLQRLNAVPLYKAFETLQPNEHERLILACHAEIKKLHDLDVRQVSMEAALADVTAEVLNKLTNRCDEISKVLAAFGDVTHVNGVDVLDTAEAIQTLQTFIHQHLTGKATTDGHVEYTFIHGDTQFSNCMLDTDGRVAIIDPRGYFGGTYCYGLPEYDFSKMLYSLSGYDAFNNSADFHLAHVGNGEVFFELPKPELFFDASTIFEPIHYAWLAVHWIGLAQYIKNNPVKSFAALCHGRYLATLFKQRVIDRPNIHSLGDLI